MAIAPPFLLVLCTIAVLLWPVIWRAGVPASARLPVRDRPYRVGSSRRLREIVQAALTACWSSRTPTIALRSEPSLASRLLMVLRAAATPGAISSLFL